MFAAQFSLSHACYLVAYPAAGWLGAWLSLPAMLASSGRHSRHGGRGLLAAGPLPDTLGIAFWQC